MQRYVPLLTTPPDTTIPIGTFILVQFMGGSRKKSIFKYACIVQDIVNDKPYQGGTYYNRTSHGWFDSVVFTDWFKKGFLPHAKRLPGTKVIIGDNLSSHFTLDVLKLCEENDIKFTCLPPNTTHLYQPLDVGFFHPLKAEWRKILTEFKFKNPRIGTVPKSMFPSLLNRHHYL